jgi:hypothetical protein
MLRNFGPMLWSFTLKWCWALWEDIYEHVCLLKVKLPRYGHASDKELFFLITLDLGTIWVESSASRPGRALPPGKDPQYLLGRRLGEPQSRSRHRG